MRAPSRCYLLIGLLGFFSSSCGVLGPTCLAQQKRGTVTVLQGEVQAGRVVSHLVPYDARGSQNNVEISAGPAVRVYLTAVECTDFTAPSSWSDARDPGRGVCQQLRSFQSGSLSSTARACAVAKTCETTQDDLNISTISVGGPGNGAPAGFHEYKVWVVGDTAQVDSVGMAAGLRPGAYTVTVTWFSGPDC